MIFIGIAILQMVKEIIVRHLVLLVRRQLSVGKVAISVIISNFIIIQDVMLMCMSIQLWIVGNLKLVWDCPALVCFLL
jgi:hypothetical protein